MVLQLGEQSNTMEVTGERRMIKTEDVVTGQTINRTFANDLPLIGRYIFEAWSTLLPESHGLQVEESAPQRTGGSKQLRCQRRPHLKYGYGHRSVSQR